MLLGGAFGVFFLFVMLLTVVPIVFWVIALVEASKAPEQAFGPPWDNSKQAWLLGLALSAVIPFAMIVTPILWWTQVRPALRAGAIVPRPFWSSRPAYPPPQQQYPPVPPPGGPSA